MRAPSPCHAVLLLLCGCQSLWGGFGRDVATDGPAGPSCQRSTALADVPRIAFVPGPQSSPNDTTLCKMNAVMNPDRSKDLIAIGDVGPGPARRRALDLSFLCDDSHRVLVLRNGGQGTFEAPEAIDINNAGMSPLQGLALGRIDADADADLAVVHAGGISVLHNQSEARRFGAGDAVPNLSGIVSPRGILLADLREGARGGPRDLAVATYNNDVAISWLINDGKGVLGGQGRRAVPDADQKVTSVQIAAAGLNSPDRDDLIVTGPRTDPVANGVVAVFENKGAATFGDPVPYRTGDREPTDLAIADLDGDCRQDLIVSHYTTGSNQKTVGILYGQEGRPATFEAAVTQRVAEDGAYPMTMAAGDLNGDGRPDLLMALFDGGKSALAILWNLGGRAFQLERLPATFIQGYTPGKIVALAIGHLNADDKPDVALIDVETQNVHVLLQR